VRPARARSAPLASKKKWVTFAALGAGAVAFAIAFFLVRAAVTALFGGGPIVDSDWRTFSPSGERFKILLPGEPRVQAQNVPGSGPINVYTVERSRGKVSFGVTVAHLTHRDLMNMPWAARFQGGKRGMLASEPNAQFKRERSIMVDGNPGLEFVIDVPSKGTLVARIIGVPQAARNSFFILMAAGAGYNEGTPEVKKFFGSFEVIPEPVPELSASLQTANSGQKIAILNQLKKHGQKALEALPALEKVLENTADPEPGLAAAELLGDLGPAAAPAAPALMNLLKTQHPRKAGPDNGNLRLRLAGALTQIDPKNEFAVES
jgi:hypothetical protein